MSNIESMKKIVLALFAIFYFVAPGHAEVVVVRGDAGACYSIPDADARSFCLARVHRNPGHCYSIKDSGMRAQCFAEVRK